MSKLKYVFKASNPLFAEDLVAGEIFRFNKQILMKVGNYSTLINPNLDEYPTIAIILHATNARVGDLIKLKAKDEVIPVEATLMVRD